MKNELMIFEHVVFGELRIVDNNGDPWFVAVDVARALGYSNPAEAVRDHCKKVNKISHHSKSLPPVNMLIIPESDMYRLVMRSNQEKAERFQDWVTSEVLPEIRRTGSYSMDRIDMTGKPSLSKLTQDLGEAIKMASHFGLDENQSRLKGNAIVRKIHGVDCMALCEITHLEYAPNIQYFTPTELGSTMNMSAKQINRLLQEKGFQKETRDHKNRLKWIVTEEGKKYSRLFDTGKIKGDGSHIQQVKWDASIIN